MRAREQSGFSRWLALLAIWTLTPILAGCCSQTASRTPSGAGESPLSKCVLRHDVQIVVVDANGHTSPKTVKVSQGVQIVIWAADADELHLTFAKNPFPKAVDCEGRFCGLLTPANGPYGTYPYTGYLVTKGVRHELDPQLEVVK